MADRRSYAFLRAEHPNYEHMLAAGWNTPLFAANDPRLAEQIRRAQEAKVQYGIWADPTWYAGATAEDFARQMAGLNQRYNPSVIVPDIEFTGKGYEGSPGWQYNQALARAWQQYLPGVNTAITVMPNQDDFNYEAWKGIAGEWLPQAYGADPKKHVFDPQQVYDTLVRRGVDPSIISPVLGPGHKDFWNSYQGNYSMWTLDDFLTGNASDIPRYQGDRRGATAQSPQTEQQPSRRPGPARMSQSAPMIQQQGLQWGGQTYTNKSDFNRYLKQSGSDWATFARKHPQAAAALMGRRAPAAGAQ